MINTIIYIVIYLAGWPVSYVLISRLKKRDWCYMDNIDRVIAAILSLFSWIAVIICMLIYLKIALVKILECLGKKILALLIIIKDFILKRVLTPTIPMLRVLEGDYKKVKAEKKERIAKQRKIEHLETAMKK